MKVLKPLIKPLSKSLVALVPVLMLSFSLGMAHTHDSTEITYSGHGDKACCHKAGSHMSDTTTAEGKACYKKHEACAKDMGKEKACCKKHGRPEAKACCKKHDAGEKQACCKKHEMREKCEKDEADHPGHDHGEDTGSCK